MIRLTVTLIVAIYIVLIVIPGRDHGAQVDVSRSNGQNWLVALITDAEITASTPRRSAPSARVVQGNAMAHLTQTADGYTLETADGEVLEIAAVIDPSALMAARDTDVATISVAVSANAGTAEEALVAEEAQSAHAPIWRVASDSVNFRAGPSTDTAVLTALSRGEEVEFLASAADDWAHLRVLSSGLEGYMAARYLEPVN